MSDNAFSFEPIGSLVSPYHEKFAIPRQPGLVKAAKGKILLSGEANNIELVRGLEQFSHLWLVFVFHGTQAQGWKPLVRPPRLGGNKKLGVLATRSTFRPNPIGMSVVTLDEIKLNHKQVEIHISGMDLLNKTPILDIKPYIPYSDALPSARAGYAQEAPSSLLEVGFHPQTVENLAKIEAQTPGVTELIQQVLAQDPRPAYKKSCDDQKEYGIRLYQYNIKWRLISASTIEVIAIEYV